MDVMGQELISCAVMFINGPAGIICSQNEFIYVMASAVRQKV